jgi:hypothetical protein
MEVVDRLIEELRPLAEKLGQGVEELYALSIRKVIIENAICLTVLVLLAVLMLMIARAVSKHFLKDRDRFQENKDNEVPHRGYYGSSWDTEISNAKAGSIIAWSIGGLLASILLWVAATMPLTRLLNPEWYAVREVLRSVGL